MAKAEAYVEDYLRSQCKKHGIWCAKFVSPGTNGVPDEIIIYNNRTIFIETKSETGRTRAIQDSVISDMREHGAEVYVCNTREEIDRILKDLYGSRYEPGTSRNPDAKSVKRKKAEPPVAVISGCRI